MSGLRVIAIYVGVAWFLASAGVLWSAISVHSQTGEQKDKISEEIAKQVEEAKASKDEAEKEQTEKIAEARQGLEEAETALSEIPEDDKKKRKAAQAKVDKETKAVEKAEKAKEKALAAIDEAIKGLEEEEKTQLAAIDEMSALAGPGGSPSVWKSIVALVVGLLLIAVGIVLRAGGLPKAGKKARPREPAFVEPEPVAIDDEEDTPVPSK